MGYQEPLRRMLDDMREESATNVLLQEEAQTISKTLSSDKNLFVSKWTDYSLDDFVSLWCATCLSAGIDSRHRAARDEDFAQRVVALGSAKDNCINGLKEVLRRYKNVLENADIAGSLKLNRHKKIELSEFMAWAAKKNWALPTGFAEAPLPAEKADSVMTPSSALNSKDVPLVVPKRRTKKPSVEAVALDYMRAEYRKIRQFQSAAAFHKHLVKTAGVDESPFEIGTGINSRKLFCPAASSFYDPGTLGKIWAKIRDV